MYWIKIAGFINIFPHKLTAEQTGMKRAKKLLLKTALMSAKGPVILVEDDEDDEDLFRETLHDLGIENRFIHFSNCIEAFSYLKDATENPLIIISDINLPRKNGIEFKKQIDEDPELRSKSIPFIFLSTATDKKWINMAYKEMTVQGFFHKTSKVQEFKRIMKIIFDYWKVCKHPNS